MKHDDNDDNDDDDGRDEDHDDDGLESASQPRTLVLL